ncbi:MAG: hypothetical protein ACRCYQ_06915, partial [Nocardioides sp.]
MFEVSGFGGAAAGGAGVAPGLDVAGWRAVLARPDLTAADDPARLRLLRELEELKAAAAAAQARIAVAYADSRLSSVEDADLGPA